MTHAERLRDLATNDLFVTDEEIAACLAGAKALDENATLLAHRAVLREICERALNWLASHPGDGALPAYYDLKAALTATTDVALSSGEGR